MYTPWTTLDSIFTQAYKLWADKNQYVTKIEESNGDRYRSDDTIEYRIKVMDNDFRITHITTREDDDDWAQAECYTSLNMYLNGSSAVTTEQAQYIIDLAKKLNIRNSNLDKII